MLRLQCDRGRLVSARLAGVGPLAVGALAVAIVACASAQRAPSATSATAPAQTMPAAPEARPHSPQDDEIARLAQEIDQHRVELALPPPTYGNPNVVPASSGTEPAVAPEPVCHPGTSSTCTQSCTLSTSICDNAHKICEIANELPGDEWAARKCSEGNQTCSAARTQCCSCSP